MYETIEQNANDKKTWASSGKTPQVMNSVSQKIFGQEMLHNGAGIQLANNNGTIYIAATNRHYILRTLPHWFIPNTRSGITGTLPGSRHYIAATPVPLPSKGR